jgi:hypothetical protein
MARLRKRTGPVATPAPPRTTTTGKQFGASVTRLDDWKARDAGQWWGQWRMHTWDLAERSRRRAS